MKKVLCGVLIIAFLIGAYIYVDCNVFGNTKDVTVTIHQNTQFEEDDIKSAMAVVKRNFKPFYGCTLTDLWYEEKQTDYGDLVRNNPNVIVLYSNFTTSDTCPAGLSKNFSYTNYSWVLMRESYKDAWKIDSTGY